MFVDTHGHVNFNAYKDDSKEVMQRALDGGVGFIMPGAQIDTSERGVNIAEKRNDPRVWAAVGLHPIHLDYAPEGSEQLQSIGRPGLRPERFNPDPYRDLASSEKVVAIGEIGLDYGELPEDEDESKRFKRRQADIFKKQLDLALEVNLPVIIHVRFAHDDALQILKEHRITNEREKPGVIHSYTGNKEQLRGFLDLGYYIGINGLIFKLDFLPSIVKKIPINRLLLETDSPYLTPPNAPTKRNEPIYVKYIAEEVSKVKQKSIEEIENNTKNNAEELFGVDFSE